MRKNHLSCVSAAAPSAEFRIACTPEPGWRKVYLFRFRIVRTDQSWFTSLLRLLYAKMANKIYTRFPKASHRPTLMSCFLVNLRATTARMYQPFFYTKGLRMAFFEFLHGVQEVEGSNPFAPTARDRSAMVCLFLSMTRLVLYYSFINCPVPHRFTTCNIPQGDKNAHTPSALCAVGSVPAFNTHKVQDLYLHFC